MGKPLEWARNIWTGNDIADVSANERIIRTRFNDGSYLYHAEFWGDHSLGFPRRGAWRRSLGAARRDLSRLRKERTDG